MPIAHRTLPPRPRGLQAPQPQSSLLPVTHLMLPLRPRICSFLRSRTPVPPLAPADGLLSPGLPMPTLKVSLPLSKSVVSAPGLAPAPVKSPAVESAPQSSPPLPGCRTSTPTFDLLPIDIGVTMSASQGADVAVVPTSSHLIWIMNTPMWIARLAYNFNTPNSSSGWGHRNMPACSAGPGGVAPGHVHMSCALQLQRDANLMTSNLNVLQQYTLSLHGTASAILQSVFGRHYFPSTAVHDAALVPRVHRASTHMATMDL